MNKRYARKDSKIVNFWTEENKFFQWLLVELTVLVVRSQRKEIPIDLDFRQAARLAASVKINPSDIDRIEREVTKHDVLAFLMHVSPQLPEFTRPWLHKDMTSYDPVDTGLSLVLVGSVNELLDGVKLAMNILGRRAMEFKYVPMVGRTHGIHAEPITFGVKIANWYDEMNRHLRRLEKLKETVAVGKLSGAVGMYTIDPEIEKEVCEALKLKPVITTQIISRDIIAEYCATLVLIAGTIGKICTTLRNLTRTEIREVMEFFDVKQRGSSAMPHKKNPISWENLTGICRDIGSRFMTAFQNQITWDERDLSNSGPERLILPEISIYLDYVLHRFAESFRKMIVFPKRMEQNLDMMKGLIYSQDVQSLVAAKSGLPREDAYELVRQVVLRCWDSDFQLNFFDQLKSDEEIMRYVSEKELQTCFSLENKLKYTDTIFKKVFGDLATDDFSKNLREAENKI